MSVSQGDSTLPKGGCLEILPVEHIGTKARKDGIFHWDFILSQISMLLVFIWILLFYLPMWLCFPEVLSGRIHISYSVGRAQGECRKESVILSSQKEQLSVWGWLGLWQMELGKEKPYRSREWQKQRPEVEKSVMCLWDGDRRNMATMEGF